MHVIIYFDHIHHSLPSFEALLPPHSFPSSYPLVSLLLLWHFLGVWSLDFIIKAVYRAQEKASLQEHGHLPVPVPLKKMSFPFSSTIICLQILSGGGDSEPISPPSHSADRLRVVGVITPAMSSRVQQLCLAEKPIFFLILPPSRVPPVLTFCLSLLLW